MIGTLMYLTASRPDLTFAICMCARYQAKPIKKHLHAIKRIFKYLRGTINWGLWYQKDSSISLIAYADADNTGCQDTRRSTSGCMKKGSKSKNKGKVPTEMELVLEQTQQEHQSDTQVITMKMEILLEPTSNKLMFDESNTYVLERFDTSAGNPVKEILLKLNLPDHRILKDGGEVLKIMPPKRTTTPMTDATIKKLIAQGVADVLAKYEVNRSSINGNDSHNSGSGRRRTKHTTRDALMWYNSYVKTAGHDAAYGMTWKILMKMLTEKYCPRSEIKMLEIKI
ncbi:hypothetical protein Tco_0393386 [Tanacetum coccineum]